MQYRSEERSEFQRRRSWSYGTEQSEALLKSSLLMQHRPSILPVPC